MLLVALCSMMLTVGWCQCWGVDWLVFSSCQTVLQTVSLLLALQQYHSPFLQYRLSSCTYLTCQTRLKLLSVYDIHRSSVIFSWKLKTSALWSKTLCVIRRKLPAIGFDRRLQASQGLSSTAHVCPYLYLCRRELFQKVSFMFWSEEDACWLPEFVVRWAAFLRMG